MLSVKSLYKSLMGPADSLLSYKLIWTSLVPLVCRFHVYLVFLEKLLTQGVAVHRDEEVTSFCICCVANREWVGDSTCRN